MGEASMSTSEIVVTLLRELVSLRDICLVIGPNEAVCEAFVDPATMDFRIDGTFATMENGPWHVHMDMTGVYKITFEVKPDTAHNSDQLSYSVRFFNAAGTALLRVFFLAMYDDHGTLRPERVQEYEALRACGGNQEVILCGDSEH
jgi:putative heme iron utilization protein